MKLTIRLLLLLFLPSLLSAQNVLFHQIQKIKSERSLPSFQLINNNISTIPEVMAQVELEEGLLIDLDLKAIKKLRAEKPEFIQLPLPLPDLGEVSVELIQTELLKHDFKVLTGSGTQITYTPGLYYRGVLSDDPSSIVAISIFEEELIGMISTSKGNYVIGKVKTGNSLKHIIYNDRDLKHSFDFDCATLDDEMSYKAEDLVYNASRAPDDCVSVYIEIDHDIVLDKGSVANAINYITGLFSESITLYLLDGINMDISEIKAWDVPSPYSGGGAGGMLNSYQANTDDFNGDLSHLVSYQASGGIAAGFNGICNADPDESKCFSSLESTYESVPTYSYSVEVVTHEMGHLIGSRHTHACVWNDNDTAIDGCAGFTEGGCPNPGSPSGGGTIMSYCHLTVGIEFTLGFGTQPRAVLLNTINNAVCLEPCGAPAPVVLTEFSASPNEQTVQLRWKTASEINSDHFVVERSKDGQSWEAIFRKDAQGFSNTGTSYAQVDRQPFAGKNYYRLLMVDFDGQREFSDWVQVGMDAFGQVRIFPNPVNERLNVVLPEANNRYQYFSLFNAQGELLLQQNLVGEAETTFSVQTEQLLSGLYLYTLSDEKGTILESGRFLKQ